MSTSGALMEVVAQTNHSDIIQIHSILSMETSNPENVELQDALLAWIRYLPILLIQLGDKHPACSQVVLCLQLRIGQCALLNPSVICMYDNMQYSLQDFYCTCQEGGNHEHAVDISSAGFKDDPFCFTLKSLTTVLCSYMAQMGDNSLVLQMIEKVIVDQIPQKPSLDNSCSLLRILVTVDSNPTRLSEQSIITLGHHLLDYLMDAVLVSMRCQKPSD
ncbi:hypothetical protein Fmac_032481 [Flemingia macrophylla]|uniref:Uncharacterized protein n=1 Tax=Flemingia macrophylla TaxID=520843 RepID=A0ABD1L6E4_9FABA